MNMVKRIMGRPRQEECSPQDNALGLMHLRRLFMELCHSPRHMTQKEQEEKLYMMLPVFNRVFGNAPPGTMMEKFSDLLQFAAQVSRLMVTEIRRRASNKSTEAASRAIVQFLEINQSEESSRGWMLLTTINLLASSGQKTVDYMTTMSLPSTLVKCLYLFFDLPHVPDAPGGAQTDLPLSERRALLQKVFVQILVKLCKYVSPAEELAQKDDLQLLFSAITSWCPPHNILWRKSAGEVLMIISRHGLSLNVVKYIHEKECVATCIQNMQQSEDLLPLEIVEMFAGLSCFLKDSSDISQVLLDDFRSCQGYQFLCDLLLRLEQINEPDAKEAVKDLVQLVTSLTIYGINELRSTGITSGAPFLLPGFAVPQPSGKGRTVKNIQAFSVLQIAFLKAKSSHLARIILDAISDLYVADNANYFILESQHTLSQFAEKISKAPEVQLKYFEMLEFIIFSLNYIPCKELISISILLKSSTSYQCSITAMKTLAKFARHDPIFRDVYREVGLLEVMVNLLHKYAALLKEPIQSFNEPEYKANSSFEERKQLALLVMETLTVLLQGSNTNAGVFREFGGARCVHNIVKYPQCREPALMIIQQLILSPSGEDDMGTLLGLMHTASSAELQLKTDILTALLTVLRESHRTRTVFRKVGGFVYVTSLLVALERSLSYEPKGVWENVNSDQAFELVHTVICTLTAAMRYEPANSHFFKTEIQYEKLADALRLLGCFSNRRQLDSVTCCPSNIQPFQRMLEDDAPLESVCPTLKYCSKVFSCLYKMATDSFDSLAEQVPPCLTHETSLPSPWSTPVLSRKRPGYHTVSTPPVFPAKSVTEVKLQNALTSLHSSDPVIIHPGAVLAMLDLLVSVSVSEQFEHTIDLQLAVANILQSLIHSERNQQVMCEAGLLARLLQRCSSALSDEDHPLHPPLQRMFERLASQSLEPVVLREFLRLGNPLNCGAWDKKLINVYRIHKPSSLSCEADIRGNMTTSLDGFGSDIVFGLNEDNTHYRISKSLLKGTEGSTVPLTRVKCLVSMTTPHDIRLHGSSVTPAFVEFDTALEGFGCLFLPSLAPHNAPNIAATTAGGVNDGAVTSGLGTGERFFPPPSGLTYSTWFCIEKLSTPMSNHPVRLLTLVRRSNSSDQHFICLAVVFSGKDRSLLVSTKEELLQNYVDDFSEESSFYEILPCCARFRCSDLINEGQWHHLVLVMSKGMLKNSTATLYVDGQHINTVKLHYIHSSPGGSGSTNLPVVSTVYGYIGTPPAQRQISSLVWRLGPTHFLEEVLPASSISIIYELGPNYVGSFQAVCVPCKDSKSEVIIPSPISLIPEEKVSFGLYALSVSSLTVARIRKNYNKVDSKTIAKQMAISSHENATPVKLLHNAAGHLNGPARTIGAALIGYLGVRTSVPRPVATTLQYIGGAAAILGLVAMASDVEGLYAAVKALVCVVKSNALASKEMERIKGYQLLAMLLKKKRTLLNSHILHLTFSLVGTVDSGHETSIIPNSNGFQDLLCDFDVWLNAPYELHLSLFEHFIELLTESSEASRNAKLMREFQLIPKLLLTLRDTSLSQMTIAAISNVLSLLLQGFPDSNDLLRFGQFLSSTLPTFAVCEKFIIMEAKNEEKEEGVDDDLGGLVSANTILLRNRLLDILLKLLYTSKEKNSVNPQACEELVKIWGFDWLLMFMEEHLHPTTVTAAMRILVVLLSNQSILAKFKEGLSGGGWLDQTDSVLTNKIGTVLGFNVGRIAGGRSTVREINRDACHVPGFYILQSFLPKHTNVPELYFLLMALFLQQPVTELPESLQFDLDSIWTFIFGVPASSGTVVASVHTVCSESAFLLLGMLRSMLNLPWQSEEEGSWLREYPVTLMQFFRYLYHNVPDLAPLWTSPDFLCAFAATVFPFNIRPYSEMVTDHDDEVGSPAEEFKAFAGDTGMNRSQSEYCNVGAKTFLTNHPARKFVFDFMRVLVIENLCLAPASKQTTLIDLLLEASPDRSTRAQQKEFQTCILDSVMDHLLAADVLLGEDATLPITSGGSYNTLVNNVFYFTQRLVDKLWQGMFSKESKLVVDFIVQLIGQTQRWERGEISNFQYLMHLNTLAGRSYNDLMQYPVFPWILADYDSEELDLTNPKTFRNLAKPMGAQTDERLAQYKKRYKDWEDPNGETPAYHYGTHYSSAMIVASYLVRMEPFTQIFLRLQGGHFDLADRMFHSVREAWYSASKHNMADVKELIPEFFYLPEFLLNSNNFDLGYKQNGIKLGDVLLPPWAKGDPREFIRVHRKALECDYVSSHLHEWIDLIFGYKQQGAPAVEAVNVFHHLFYEGQVDIYNINDPLKETATIGFINNFGQIPKQLFKKPHPPKRTRSRNNGEPSGVPPSLSCTTDKIFFHHLDNLRPSLAPVKELKEPVGQIIFTDKGVLAVEQNKVLIPPSWNKTFAWGYADLSCRVANYESDKALIVYECLSEWGQILCTICPNPKLVVTGGTSTTICVWEMGTSKEKAKTLTLKQALHGHTDAVTCLTTSSAYHIIVSGSRDRTCIIWDLNKLSFVTQLRGHRAPVSALCINELTGDIVSCAGTYIHVWNINGNPVVNVNTFTGRSQQIFCCCVSEMSEWDTQNVIVTGHSDGVVRFWRMEFLQVPETPAPEETIKLPENDDSSADVQLDGDAQDEESSDSDLEDQCSTQDPKPKQSVSGCPANKAKGMSGRAAWFVDGDESKRWADQLSLDEKDGFVFVNYSEGQPKLQPQAQQQPQVQSQMHYHHHQLQQHSMQSEIKRHNQLKQGYRWERQLVFRSKLTMHTAFDRKDNCHPAEITALGISKDHSKILVGDARGRVFSWSVSDQPGRTAADHWIKDDGGDCCSGCSVRFSLTERRHHCRNCGQLFCQKCSRFQSEIRRLKISSPVRVCQNCYYNLQQERGAEESSRN
ncbi:WD repeat and FYVE domain-containing protein 3 [Rhincodon typus]|uniref:WD repeat and FYVE domain-containing protein 3 n=1 Tax=Rhincodon typus TaxID=259920 RepID=UPI00202E1886|nr:WD repeat and FYVE domain-containing protein 3 [Rhincodon typus]